MRVSTLGAVLLICSRGQGKPYANLCTSLGPVAVEIKSNISNIR